ncbi:L-type lectin-domain containing receptor kinase IX.1-like [Rutidosis leptorrhynchoides]|uniref:L-type lectin-domain containing receptor kinase IX.1-like n=1 Tax=Rutidosis leptorrhynchoides TaxID=125765 RepID=UPI003A99B2CD
MVISIYFLLVLFPHAASITFDFPYINPQNLNTDIVTTGVVSISNDGIQLIPDQTRFVAARGTYVNLLHLWDKASNKLASFSTQFSFVIESKNYEDYYADGLTFFLAENNSLVPDGGALGLPVNNLTNLMVNPFVAVEFDTLWNAEWDPADFSLLDYHVGINVNSLNSSAYQKWKINITEGAHCQAIVKYDSASKTLSLSVTDIQYGVIEISYVIDLRTVLPEWVLFGFSAATGIRFEKITVKSWSFNSSRLLVDDVKPQSPPPPPTTSPGPHQGKGESRVGSYKVGLIVGLCVVILFGLSILIFCLWRRKNNQDASGMEMNKDFEMGTGPKRFSYNELVQATNGFVDANKLGQGGFGGVYKGFLKDLGTYVAVKRVSKTSQQGIKEYVSEVKIISRLRHKNLVELKGWCHERGELLLVYEYMENGSLDLHLFKQKSLLTWGTRYKIACGLASALLYLHDEWEKCVLHRDIKASNLMLDSKFNAKLGDFGLAKLVDHDKSSNTTMLAGTLGYMAPECLVTGKASKESDVYSFGVVALEIACGRKPIEKMAPENEIQLIEWVWMLYGNGAMLEAVDPRLGLDYDEHEIKRLVTIGLWCVHPDSELRPSMRQVINVLNYEASLPILPSNMPVASYLTPMIENRSSSSASNVDSLKQTTSSSESSCLYGR